MLSYLNLKQDKAKIR